MSDRYIPEISKASAIDRRQFLTAAGGLLLSFTLETGGGRAAQAGRAGVAANPSIIQKAL